MEKELSDALDDLILGRGVARGRHSLTHQGRPVRAEFEERLRENGFAPTTVRAAEIEAGEKVPAFYLHGDTADFGLAQSEELRQAVARLQKTGKKVYAHTDSAMLREYTLLSGTTRLSASPTADL